MKGFIIRRLFQPLFKLITQGITPEKITLSLAMGIVLGIFPVLGSTTFLCAAVAVVCRLNLPAIQLVNWLVYPLQVILLVPFIRAGEFVFRVPSQQLPLAQILALVRTKPAHAIASLWVATLHAISVWLMVGPVMIFLLYVPLAHLLRHAAYSAQTQQHADGNG